MRSIKTGDMNRQEYEREKARDPTLNRNEGTHKADLQHYPATDRQCEYWRARPQHLDNPTKPDMKVRLCLSTVNYGQTWGKKGKMPCNGVMMPPGCAITQKEMTGKKFADQSTSEKRVQRTLKKVDALRPLSTSELFDRAFEGLHRFAKEVAEANNEYAT